jgi:hypothetical protein
MACKGNSNETCGAGNRLNVFWSGVSPPPAPATLPSTGNWTSLGCYKYEARSLVFLGANVWFPSDTAANRALGVTMATQGSVSIESCTTACFNAGYVSVHRQENLNLADRTAADLWSRSLSSTCPSQKV